MFGLDLFGIKRRRLAREAADEAQRQRLRERAAPIPRLLGEASAATRSRTSASSSAYSPMNDPLSPLNPLSPFGLVSQAESYSTPRHDPEPSRGHCSPAASSSDDSWSRSSSCSGSDYSLSSSSDLSSSSSGSDSSSW